MTINAWVLVVSLLSHDASGQLTKAQAVVTAGGFRSEEACYAGGKQWLQNSGYVVGDGSSRITCAPTRYKEGK